MSKDFEVYDCLLSIERMLYSHTETNIVSFLKKAVVEFGLKGKITCVVTDNESNMVNAINQWDDVVHLPCAAYILQLSIYCAFKKQMFILSGLNVYFTDDDSDDNDNSTNELPMLDSTNSNQPILHKAIEWLSATLPLSDNAENRADGRKLKKRLLLPYEWDLLKQIVDLLEPFDDATTYFSKTFYATLSIIYPLIKIIISQNSPS
ncbi:6029_t:CDS:2 [Funneliformis geosporum]|uniref:6029_t:CDS:1 n=1 Tax=Funneliformis geosporum TaxID=1117311 RepID=A0A9W4WXX8_9GLOM|nr:6029_t:CDS:2 [Funneliformis geosporum]